MDASAVKSTAANEKPASMTTENGPVLVAKKTRHRKKKKRHGAAAAAAAGPEATGSSSLEKVLAETASGPLHSVNGSTSAAPRSFSPCSGSSIEKFSSGDDEEGRKDEVEDVEEDEYSSESEDEGESGYKPGGYHRVEVGEVYNSRFQVLEKLGWGHFSTVWKCVDRQTGATVALKVQKSARHYTDAARDEIELLECTVRAAKATQTESTIGQQEVIKVVCLIDSFEHKGPNGLHVCMVFEMMGDNLLTLIKYYNYRGVPLQLVRRLTRDMMEGLAFLHGKCEIIHTDLKPENVLLTHHIPQLPKIRKSQWDEFRATRLARYGKSADMFRNEDKSTGKVSNRTVASAASSAEVSKEEKKRLKNRLKKKRQKQRKQCGKNERGPSTDADTAGNKMGSTARPSLSPSDASVDSLRSSLSQLAFSASIDNTSPTDETFKSNFAGHAVDCISDSTNVTRVWCRQVGQLGDEEERDWVHMPPEFAARAMLLLPEGRVAGSKRKEREFTIALAAESTQSPNECASDHGKDDEVLETSFVLRYLDHVDDDVIKSIRGQVLGLCGRSVSPKSVSTTGVTYRVWRLEFDARYTHAVLYFLERRIEGLRFLNLAPSSGFALPGFFLPKPLGDQDVKRVVEDEDTGHCDSAADVIIQGINLASLAGSFENVLEIVPLRQRLGRWALRLNNIAHGELFDVMKLDAKICDLGNACWTTKHFTDDIQTRQYRCPEVILGKRYDTSADIWSMACFVFELLTGDLLFDPKNGRSFNRDEDHLAQMMELLGRMPKSFTGSRQSSRDFFNRKGDLKRIRNLKYWSLQQVLIEKYHFSRVDAECLASFLSPMLRYEPSKRATASECLAHPWLTHVDDVVGKNE
uniref:non-specific serine/threonine protein kinase n=1 Tax=Peronospora matthiolae TaxID=2874970 RepID=A0AAV1V618_9STRA